MAIAWEVVCLLLAFLMAYLLLLGIGQALGVVLAALERRCKPCPHGGRRALSIVDEIRETYPTGRGTGNFFVCDQCRHRTFWSNDDSQWQDANAEEFERYYRR